MKQYQFLNNLFGWIVFVIASTVYILTIEPTTSFWDCGEFITSAFKLEVGHPPGAPFFMIIGRVFALFAFGDVSKVAMMLNTMSALASGATILFLFWTITHIAKRLIVKNNEINLSETVIILGSALVGSLAYTFSDTFWFSAVEGEVYATSSLFTALVFWAILKWENVADEKYANRWLIFIAYLMGISIGVHLLNLLVIPAIVFVYYFRKYKPSTYGIIFASIASVVILALIQYGIMPGIVTVASKFELLFVNSLGTPYNVGVAVYAILLIGSLSGGIYFTSLTNKVIPATICGAVGLTLLGIPFMLQNIFLSLLMLGLVGYVTYYLANKYRAVLNTVLLMGAIIMIGYSSFALIIIRSQAKTPMNQNSPDNFFALLSYLNREQYGDRPLFYGQSFNAPVVDYKNGRPEYIQRNGRYEIIDYRIEYEYPSEYKSLFPRMYSSEESPPHIDGYLTWAGLKESDVFEPVLDENNQPVQDQRGGIQYDRNRPRRAITFAENLKFLFKYQINYMYVRYFLWNFVGRQNDIQGNGDILYGNWLSGIKFVDQMRLGDQDKYPEDLKKNPGRNVYFFLPLLLGLAGIALLYKRDKRNLLVLLLFFFFTGLAIIFYTNQPPYQPRERDYAYAGSFYVFAIFIGFGVIALYDLLRKVLPGMVSVSAATAVCVLAAPVLMGVQNWNDHDRSNRYTARDFAYNYLNSCAPNAILFTNGDNDTFPLWYAQEVEGIRTDVRVINLSYLNTDWYIDQMKRAAYNSLPVPFSLTHEQYLTGSRDIVRIGDDRTKLLAEKYRANRSKYEAVYQDIYTRFYEQLKSSKFPETQAKDFDVLSKGADKVSFMQVASLINRLASDDNITKFELNKETFKSLKAKSDSLLNRIADEYVPIQTMMKFITDESPDAKIQVSEGRLENYMPTDKLSIPVDRSKIEKNNIVPPSQFSQILPRIDWKIGKRYVRKNELMVMDLLATSNWDRPVYFAVTVGPSAYINLQNYFQLEGLAYRFVPLKTVNYDGQTGAIPTDLLYKKMIEEFRWGGIDSKDKEVYLDENNNRMLMNMRNNFARLADALIKEGKRDSAIKVLDRCEEIMPHDKVQYNFYNLLIATAYYDAGEDEKANKMIKILADDNLKKLDYYLALPPKFQSRLEDEDRRSYAIIDEIINVTKQNKQDNLSKEVADKLNNILKLRMGVPAQQGVPPQQGN